jgi:hypothetical protein
LVVKIAQGFSAPRTSGFYIKDGFFNIIHVFNLKLLGHNYNAKGVGGTCAREKL